MKKKQFILCGVPQKKSTRVIRSVKSAMLTLAATVCILGTALLFFGDNGVQTDASIAQKNVSLPILMYHSILKNPQRAGDYVVCPDVFKEDLQYLKKHGYESIVVQDLINYVYYGVQLPEKPVMITLDDGYYNNLTYVLPILEKLDMKAVISVVGSYSEKYSDSRDPNPNYAYLSFEDINTMRSSGRIEIQNHSYDMHSVESRRGTMKKSGESEAQYREVFCSDAIRAQQLLKENCGFEPTAFTYPFGYVSKESEDYLKDMGFLCSMICFERINIISDEESLFNLGRFNRPSGITTEAFMKKILPDQS